MPERSIRSHSAICAGDGMADMPDSDSGVRKDVRVQIPPCAYALLAQMAEHLAFNQGAAGSIPAERTYAFSSVGQSTCLISKRSQVRVL